MSSVNVCSVCGIGGLQLRCSRCHTVYYCSKEHQRIDWKKHKVICNTKSDSQQNIINGGRNNSVVDASVNFNISTEGISNIDLFSDKTEELSSNLSLDFREEKSPTEKTLRCAKSAMPIQGENRVLPRKSNFRDFPEISLQKKDQPPFLHRNNVDCILDEVCRNVIRDMDAYGLCVVDNFLGEDRGRAVLDEVLTMYSSGVFKDGQLVSNKGRQDLKTIRGDQITWIDGREKFCSNIGYLINQVDAVVMRANKMVNNGKLGSYTINGRTKVRFITRTILFPRYCIITVTYKFRVQTSLKSHQQNQKSHNICKRFKNNYITITI